MPRLRRKLGRRKVNYRQAVKLDQSCGTCAMFHPATGACDLVKGKVSALGVCDRWTTR